MVSRANQRSAADAQDIASWIMLWGAGSNAQRPALEFGARSVSYGDLAEQMLARASAFVHDDDRPVAVTDPDPIEFTLTTLGVIAAGRSPLLVNPSYPEAMVSGLISRCGAVPAALFERTDPLTRPVPSRPWADGMLLTTSGTTGMPKIVRRSRQADAASALTNPLRGWPMRVGSRLWVPVPVASAAMPSLVLGALVSGATAVLDRFDAVGAGEFVRGRGIDGIYMVPTMLRLLLRSSHFRQENWSGLSMLFWGGEPMDEATEADVISAMGDIVHTSYGSTEVMVATASNPLDRARFGRSAGRPTALHSVRIIGDDGQVLGVGQEGEIETTGVSSYRGYFGEEPPASPWYRTGDVGVIDDSGSLHVNGRRSLVVNVGGNRLSPEGAATALREMPLIEQAAVVAIEDEVWGSRLHAFVTLVPGAAIDVEETLMQLRKVLPASHVPRGISVINMLPIDPSGKLSSRTLQAWARESTMAHDERA
ncbi:class I adenylate-forming enzyme family protein [Arthrobacter sp. W4I7]|uniref:class I adenylate-forming enzyme family protein n=1 Tax=Arthrobacter sp. W4I7 TaxID=3042296 RepID=UPI00278A9A65|nr:long-chain fatty acid--CoA ligase [Arthrobacter sp. W4I7]MDQ0691447.1 acyl-coenzyme A synthetase/AMP-(fatty) acid ligase [Arthrobacter sp. W4I7]